MAALFSKIRDLILHNNKEEVFPSKVDEAVDTILPDLSEYDRHRIANMNQDRLRVFHQNFVFYIMNKLRLWTNEPLKQSCCELNGVSKVSTDQASYIILKELQNRIKQASEVKD